MRHMLATVAAWKAAACNGPLGWAGVTLVAGTRCVATSAAQGAPAASASPSSSTCSCQSCQQHHSAWPGPWRALRSAPFAGSCAAAHPPHHRSLSSAATEIPAFGSKLPSHVTIYEVGPRDGLQNEAKQIPTEVKVKFIDMLSQSGLQIIEATSFVSPKWVPQLADAASVMASIHRRPGVVYSVLTPNLKGFEAALKAGAQEVAIFAAASDAFSRKNLNCGVQESLRRFDDVAQAAKQAGLRLRGYVSTAVHCPYSGAVDPKQAADVAVALDQMGCREVSMSDTTGAGTPASVARMFEEALKHLPASRLAAHMHDTYGQAVANILVALQLGVATVDSSVAGLGGCPYSPGASGNVATEDVVYMLNGLGISHGVDLNVLLDASEMICGAMGRQNASRAAKALLAARAAARAAPA